MDRRIELRNRSCFFDPPDSFQADIITYHGVRGSGEVSEGSSGVPFHSTMSPEALDSYLSWRMQVWDRGHPEPD